MSRRRIYAELLMLSALLGGVGCASDGDSSTVSDDETAITDAEANAMDVDPDGLLAALAFPTATDDARYRCLLSTLDEDSKANGLAPSTPFEYRGSFVKVWCDARGEDAMNCARGFLDDMEVLGSRARAVTAQVVDSDVVEEYGYTSVHFPTPEASDFWSIRFSRTSGSSDRFSAVFVPFEGETYDRTRLLVVSSGAGYSTDGVTVSLAPTRETNTHLDLLTESPARFTQLMEERYDGLLAAFEARLNEADISLDEQGKAVALQTARNELGAMRALAIDNADVLQPLLVDQVSLDQCRDG